MKSTPTKNTVGINAIAVDTDASGDVRSLPPYYYNGGKKMSSVTTCMTSPDTICENNDKFAIDRKLPEIEERRPAGNPWIPEHMVLPWDITTTEN